MKSALLLSAATLAMFTIVPAKQTTGTPGSRRGLAASLTDYFVCECLRYAGFSLCIRMRVFDPKVSERDTILDLHSVGDLRQHLFVYAEVLGDAIDRGDVMDLVDVRGHAARAEIVEADEVQFQSSSSSSR